MSAKNKIQPRRSQNYPYLKEIIRLQRKNESPLSLATNIGDGYLMASNPIYQNLRVETLKAKAKFELSNDHRDYCWSLLGLESILKTGRIPYFDNFSGLLALEKRRPGYFALNTVKILPQGNFILHESAHFLFESLRKKHPLKGAQTKNDLAGKILPILLSEACANSAEFFAAQYCTETVAAYFFDMNSYTKSREARPLALTLLAVLTPTNAFRLMTVFFLFANYLKETKSATVAARVLDICTNGKERMNRENRPILLRCLDFAMNLNPAFRQHTTETYLHYLGFDGSIKQMTAATLAEMYELSRISLPLLDSFSGKVLDHAGADA